MKWEKLSKTKAAEHFKHSINTDETLGFTANESYRELATDLNTAYSPLKNETKEYRKDLLFGLELYDILNNKYGLTPREASDNEIWNYLSIKVVPNIVSERWGLNEARFYKENRRVWLKTIWWYIHLSWNQDKETTLKTLEKFTTDTIAQLVERPGPYGYRREFTRELMKQIAQKNVQSRHKDFFRRAMKLNTARTKVVEPALYPGGIESYVEELINYFDYEHAIPKNT